MIAFKVDGKVTKAKVKKVSTFFDHTLHTTKEGVVVTPSWELSSEIFPTLNAAQEAIQEAIKARNTAYATWADAVPNCINKVEALDLKRLWCVDGDNSPIYWGEQGGQAVAVKLDSLGKRVDYLSLSDWAANGWELPEEGDWHFFSRSL